MNVDPLDYAAHLELTARIIRSLVGTRDASPTPPESVEIPKSTLTPTDLEILQAADERDGPVPKRDLIRASGSPRNSNTSARVTGLVRAGLLSQTSTGNAVTYAITEAGIAVLDSLDPARGPPGH